MNEEASVTDTEHTVEYRVVIKLEGPLSNDLDTDLVDTLTDAVDGWVSRHGEDGAASGEVYGSA